MTLLNFRFIFFAALFSLIISPAAVQLALKLGLVDRPNAEPHKTHVKAAPLAGGIVIASIILSFAFAAGLFGSKDVRAILAGGVVVLLFGALDDHKSLSPIWKMVGQVIAAGVMVLLGVQVLLFRINLLNVGLTLLWVVGVTNAFNFVDSMDGLASGLAGVAAGFFVLVAYESGQLQLSSFSAILVGICAGVYYSTAMPARYFLGDSGAQLLGFVLGGLAIAYNPSGFLPTQSWYIPVLLVGVPIFDTALVIISRLRRHKPIYKSGLDHTYHRLVALGMHPNRAVLTMHFMSILLGCLAFIALSLPPLWSNVVFMACLTAGLVGLIFLEKWYRPT